MDKLKRSDAMKEEEVDFFKNHLTEKLVKLLHQADDAVNNLLERDDTPPDPLDRALIESEQSFSLRIRDRESKLIKKIRSALDKIDTGEYGICEVCEEDIALARLKARPVTTKCIDCKTKEEALEKVMGI